MKCPICDSYSLKTLYADTLGRDLPSFDYAFKPESTRTYEIVQCESCTHAFSIVTHKDIGNNYEDVIDNEYLKRQDERILTARNVMRVLSSAMPRGTLLDVGCATGDFLQVAQEEYSVEGLELSEWSAQIARDRGFIVNTCRLYDLPPEPKYDIVTLFGVIEHFENPRLEIGCISKIIRPNGIVCLWTGDINGWVAKLLGKKWWYIQGQHIQYFSKSSLNRLFSDFGFKMELIQKYPYVTNFKSINKSLGRYKHINVVTTPILENRILADKQINLALPGEMCVVFRKGLI